MFNERKVGPIPMPERGEAGLRSSRAARARVWVVAFEVNGGEYTSRIYITADRVEQLDRADLLADGVQITIDEPIVSITREGRWPSSNHHWLLEKD